MYLNRKPSSGLVLSVPQKQVCVHGWNRVSLQPRGRREQAGGLCVGHCSGERGAGPRVDDVEYVGALGLPETSHILEGLA